MIDSELGVFHKVLQDHVDVLLHSSLLVCLDGIVYNINRGILVSTKQIAVTFAENQVEQRRSVVRET